MSNKGIPIVHEIMNFYSEKLKNFGNSSQGVGWKDDSAQVVRFDQLLKIIGETTNFSAIDFGCGSGQFYKHLRLKGYEPSSYRRYEILDEMRQIAKEAIAPDARVSFLRVETAKDMALSDYSVASGTFNVKGPAREKDWLAYILSSIALTNERSRIGFAFNLLTSYSDKEFMQSYLCYADPLYLFDHCKKKFSTNVACYMMTINMTLRFLSERGNAHQYFVLLLLHP